MAKQPLTNVTRGLLAGAALFLAVGALAVGAAGADTTTTSTTATTANPAAPPTKTNKLGDNYYSPSKVTVVAGTVVTFKWTGSNTHNVTVVSGPKKFTSPNQSDGTYDRTFTKPGTYKIVCTFHPGMTLTLTVKKPPKTATTTTTTARPSS
jgi:plastocyanin